MKPASTRPIALVVCFAIGALACSVPSVELPAPTGPAAGSGVPPTASSQPVRTPLPNLPALVADLAGILQWCEPWEGMDPDLQPIECTDAIAAAVRATGPLQGSILEAEVMYRPPCPVPDGCGALSPDRAFVSLLSRAAGPLLVEVVRTPDEGILAFAPGPGPAPPAAPVFNPPAVQRLDLPGAPAEFSDRDPLPFCGRSDMYTDADASRRCFVLAVRSGTPAELILDGFSVEGDPVTHIYRFGGAGAVVMWVDASRDRLAGQQWPHRPCVMYRFVEPDRFACG